MTDYKVSFSTTISPKAAMIKTPVALITGISGQDGSYLAELLLSKGYIIHGMIRRSATPNTKNIDHIIDKISLHYGDLTDGESIDALIYEIQPDEIYHLGAQSDVRISFDIPEYTSNVVALGTLRMLEATRRFSFTAKFYNAATSEMFGNAIPPQSEETPMHPKNPYGIAKLAAYEWTRLYRESYGLFACSGILFNHESERRGDNFVTQKIVKGLINCKLGKQKKLYLGNIDASRDWGYSRDYVEAMWMMLQQKAPTDLVIGTGEVHTIREFLEVVGKYVKIEWSKYVEIDSDLYRPTETNYLLANPKKAEERIGWKPKIKFEELVKLMIDAELKRQGVEI
jgi:GDPmannose 4,6-dehydratase